MSEAVYHEQFKDKWRERLFYQYKLYVDNIARLHSHRHVSLTIYIFINGFLMVSALVSLGAEAIVRVAWLDVPYEVFGILSSIGYYGYIWHIHRRNIQMVHSIQQIESDLPPSLLVMTSPTNVVVRIIEDMVPLFFIAAYVYIYFSMHVLNR